MGSGGADTPIRRTPFPERAATNRAPDPLQSLSAMERQIPHERRSSRRGRASSDQQEQNERMWWRLTPLHRLCVVCLLSLHFTPAFSFLPSHQRISSPPSHLHTSLPLHTLAPLPPSSLLAPALLQRRSAPAAFTRRSPPSSSPTALRVWWFGGSELFEEEQGSDSCELVPVRIERTSANSRRILGEINVPNLSLDDVWSILTDYDRLSTHVPNLVESRIVARTSPGQPGDGQFTCKLYQKGAQKIVGFEFGASVTMNMREQVVSDRERRIKFQCVDSFFFQEFDGEWKVVERTSPDGGSVECTLSYVVDVRPKGPVPVAALEWRIREDVPTNLRAVKKAAADRVARWSSSTQRSTMPTLRDRRSSLVGNLRNIMWEKSETMAAYLDQPNQ